MYNELIGYGKNKVDKLIIIIVKQIIIFLLIPLLHPQREGSGILVSIFLIFSLLIIIKKMVSPQGVEPRSIA